MFIFEEPKHVLVFGIVLAIVFFAIQLLLCFKVKKPMVKRIPAFVILLLGVLILLICIGLFGEGSGFIGNVHLIVAAILAIVGGIASIGILAAWIVYKIYMKTR